MKAKETLVGPLPKIAKRLGVISHGRATGAAGRMITFEDGSQIEVDGVVWATGFSYDHSWIALPITDEHGLIKHRRGVTEIPGLYTLGLQWQWTRGSALLGFVKDDATFIAEQILARAGSVRRADGPAREMADVTTAAQGD
jgi:putative flavoprotein involved in K+ transport